jgi:hypothetical protein
MSDAFGPDDSTASGGLQSDMPGIGAAPGNARGAPTQLPSALGGLAQALHQMLGGTPSPRPPQQGRPPFQPPGQGQGPQSRQQQGGPAQGNDLRSIMQSLGVPPEAVAQLPGPIGATAKAAVPYSPLQPQWPPKPSESGPYPSWPPPWKDAKVQTYTPASPIRPPSQWGQPDRFQATPGAWEAPYIFRGASQYFAQQGSQFSRPLALGLGNATNAYWNGYMKGETFKVKMAYDQMRLQATQLAQQQQQQLADYGDAIAEFGGDISTGEGADAKLTMKGVGNLQDALEAVANKYGDERMLAVLASGNLAGAENMLKQRDARLRDLHASNKSLEDHETQTEADAPYKIQPQNADGTPSDKGAAQPSGFTVGPKGVTITRPDPPQTTPMKPFEGGAAAPTSLEGVYGDSPDDRTPGDGSGADPEQQSSAQPQTGAQAPRAARAVASGAQPQPRAGVAGAQPQVAASGAQPQADDGTPQLPREGVQVAEGGDSDAPPSWLGSQGGGGQRAAQADPQATPSWSPTPSQSLLDAYKRKWNPVAVDAIAQKIITGETKASDYAKNNPALWPLAQRRAQEIVGDLQAVHGSNLTGSKLVNAVNKVAPNIASDLQSTLDGVMQITAGRGTAEVRAYNRILTDLAHKADPQWTPQDWQLRQQFRASFTPTGRAGQSLLAGQRMATSAANVIQAVKEVGPGNIRLGNEWRQWIANDFTGGGQYTNLFNALRDYVGQEVRVMRGGSGAVYDEKSLLENMSVTGSAAQIIGALKVHTRDARATLTNLNNGYQTIVHGQSSTPLYDKDAEDALTAIERMNPNTLGYDPRDLDPRTGRPPKYLQVDPIGTGADIDPATGRPKAPSSGGGLPSGWKMQ